VNHNQFDRNTVRVSTSPSRMRIRVAFGSILSTVFQIGTISLWLRKDRGLMEKSCLGDARAGRTSF
jgi:hypothetical protein